ncbi:hypothetical protein BDK51DRAFT_47213, partial [Blyttiomyces helicus]
MSGISVASSIGYLTPSPATGTCTYTPETRLMVLHTKGSAAKGVHLRHRVLVPNSMICEILHPNHEHQLAGHLGRAKTKARICKSLCGDNMTHDVLSWIACSLDCALRKPPEPPPKAFLQSIALTKENYLSCPFGLLSFNCVYIPTSTHGLSHIMVFTDHFTKWKEAVAVPDLQSATICQDLFDIIVYRLSPPFLILTERSSPPISPKSSLACSEFVLSPERAPPPKQSKPNVSSVAPEHFLLLYSQ